MHQCMRTDTSVLYLARRTQDKIVPLVEFQLDVRARIEQVVQVRGDAVLQLSISASDPQRQRCQEAVHLMR